MNRLLVKVIGKDNDENLVIVFYCESQETLNNFVMFNNNSLDAKKLIYKVEEIDSKSVTVYVNPFVGLNTFLDEARKSFDGDVYFTIGARQSYVRAMTHDDLHKVYPFDEVVGQNTKNAFGG